MGESVSGTITWVPCRAQLPQEGERVLVAIYGADYIHLLPGEEWEDAIRRVRHSVRRVDVGYVDRGEWRDADGYMMVIQPSYWAAMPAAPKEEE